MSSSDQLLAAAWTGAVQGAIACAAPGERTRASSTAIDPRDQASAEPQSEVRELHVRERARS